MKGDQISTGRDGEFIALRYFNGVCIKGKAGNVCSTVSASCGNVRFSLLYDEEFELKADADERGHPALHSMIAMP